MNYLKEFKSFEEQIIGEMVSKARYDWEVVLKKYLRTNLAALGFIFEEEDEFLKFTKERISMISFEESPHELEFYVDFKDLGNRGTLIGICNDKLNLVMDSGTASITIG